MASNQADVPRDILKRVNLVLLAGVLSQVWQYFRFKTEEGKVLEPSQVSFLILTCDYVCANNGTFMFITFSPRCSCYATPRSA